ncbi:diguanylate cyclase [Curvibacter sp. APW13]|uniref:GGDEF domain-containing protein n=1 Tax=Curvibacter sp. APW13 TaxID=3077236 RepID=UPI0028DEF00F|nr:diguanylate cyclase [Curvibacter sp. APW13]MDT8991481.1 diguanylate cyclase [Curvibacter sp. APW13]
MKFRLALAIATFVVLDLGALAFSYSIARQVELDAVAINLAGRQRMLSQRITKASLLAISPTQDAALRQASAKEADAAYKVFRRTLLAFAQGGETVGGDGRTVQLQAVRGSAALLVGEVRGLLEPWSEVPSTAPQMAQFSQFMVERNGAILEAMNQLTTSLESQSVAAVSSLRIAQTVVFSLSLLNFLFILWGMHQGRVRAEREAVTDSLTGLLNRGGFYAALRQAFDQRDDSTNLGVMLLDIDGFKGINDTYGHAAGDDALREAARRLQGLAAKGWTCGRLGGDEFAIICPGMDIQQMQAGASHVCEVMAGIPVGTGVVGASVGWAIASGHSSPDAVLAAADRMMYEVKGRRYQSHSYRFSRRTDGTATVH